MSMSMVERIRAAARQVEAPKKEVKLSELQEKVFAFVLADKTLADTGIPLPGATTVEIAKAFPDTNSNSLRFAVYRLRKLGLLTDSGNTRALLKGETPCVVWTALGHSMKQGAQS